MGQIRQARGSRVWRTAKAVATVINEDRAFRRAIKRMPRPVPWDWARPRILPLLAGPYLDVDDDPPIRGISNLGCAIVYGAEIDGAFALVDRRVAERWECTIAQIHEIAMLNLRARAAALPRGTVRGGTLSGRIIQITDRRVGWSSSLLLVPDQLMRLFGSADQVFGAPGRSTLVSLPLATPSEIVAYIVVELELGETWPLMLDPFALVDGRLYWQSDSDEDDLDEQDFGGKADPAGWTS